METQVMEHHPTMKASVVKKELRMVGFDTVTSAYNYTLYNNNNNNDNNKNNNKNNKIIIIIYIYTRTHKTVQFK